MLKIDNDNAVTILTLDRPHKLNAMSLAMVEQLTAVLGELENAGTPKPLVLAAHGKAFCAGSDLQDLSGMSARERKGLEAASAFAARLLTSFPAPVIAAVSGFAYGGGLTLAASCDVVISSPATKWWLPEVAIGLFPAWGLAAVEARVGRSNARRLSWGTEPIDTPEAHRLGLVDQIAADPLAAAVAHGKDLAKLPAAQVRAVKDYFALCLHPAGETCDRAALEFFARTNESPEAAETFRKYAKS